MARAVLATLTQPVIETLGVLTPATANSMACVQPSGGIEEGGSTVAVVSSHTCLAVTQVSCICPYGLLLLSLSSAESLSL